MGICGNVGSGNFVIQEWIKLQYFSNTQGYDCKPQCRKSNIERQLIHFPLANFN